MRVLVVEDEIHSFRSLQLLLQRCWPESVVLGPVESVAELRRMLQRQGEYDVILSDIRLEDGTCFAAYGEAELSVPVVFVTAYDAYAIQAFSANGVDYLLKPVTEEGLRRAMERAMTVCRGKQAIGDLQRSLGMGDRAERDVLLSARGRLGEYMLSSCMVSHFVVDGHHVMAFTNDGLQHQLGLSLEQLKERLDAHDFFRVNRQYIVSRRALQALHQNENRKGDVSIAGFPELKLSVSRAVRPQLLAWMRE